MTPTIIIILKFCKDSKFKDTTDKEVEQSLIYAVHEVRDKDIVFNRVKVYNLIQLFDFLAVTFC